MHIKFTIAVVASISASSALSDARINASSQLPSAAMGLAYAQANIDALDESDLKRLVFYTNRATGALRDVVNGAGAEDANAQEKKNKLLLSAISRLADAGQRSGLSVDQVADYFTSAVSEEFGPDFTQNVSALTGGQSLNALFQNASGAANSTSTESLGFIAALNAASSQLTISDSQFSDPVQVDTSNVPGPVALPGATNAEREVVQRVVVNQGRWEITVIQGDSLSEMAGALYGDPAAYNTIFDANAAAIADPNTLEVDTVLVLPKP